MQGEILKGHLDMIVLAVLAGRPAHGYGVIQEIRKRSGGVFDLPEGTIYPVLHRLERIGLVSSTWAIEGGRRRRLYGLTTTGQQALKDQRLGWKMFVDTVFRLFGETTNAAAPHVR